MHWSRRKTSKFGGSRFASNGDPTQKTDARALPITSFKLGRGRDWTRFYNWTLASLYAHEGRFKDAADTLLAMPPQQNLVTRQAVVDAARVLRSAPQKWKSQDTLPEMGSMVWASFYVGVPDRTLDWQKVVVDTHYLGNLAPPWFSEFAPIRKSEQFKALVRKSGLVDYWRARGWPDLCYPTTGDDFECN
jgi:hypothetical protein